MPHLPTLALLALPLLPLAPEVCDDCSTRRLCKPHAQAEAEALARLEPELDSEEAGVRMAALKELAALTEAHQNAPGQAVAERLAAALEDDSLRVRERALRLLTDGQHPEVTVEALTGVLGSFEKNMWSLVPWLTGPAEERGSMLDAMAYLETAMRVCADVPDDRVVDALGDLLLAFPSEMRGQPVAMAASRSLLELRTRDAVETVLKQFQTLQPGKEMRNLHDALVDLAIDLEVEDYPEFGEDVDDDWERWLRKHSRRLPSKLGRWTGRPLEEER